MSFLVFKRLSYGAGAVVFDAGDGAELSFKTRLMKSQVASFRGVMAFQEKPLGQNCGGMGGFKPSRALRVALKLDSLRFSLRFEARAWRTSAGVLSTGSRWDFLVEMSDPRRPVTPPGRLCCPRAARMWLHPMG